MRKIILGAVALVATTAFPSAASAVGNDLVLTETGTGWYAENQVTASCQAGPGATLDLNYVTYVVRGVAHASSKSGAIPVGTTISCWIRDRVTGAVWGPPVNGFAPTGVAAAAGTIRAKSTGNLMMCAEAYALFNDNRPAAHYKTYGC